MQVCDVYCIERLFCDGFSIDSFDETSIKPAIVLCGGFQIAKFEILWRWEDSSS